MIEIVGEINFVGKFNTVADIREFLATLEKHGVKDDAALLDGYATIIYSGDVEPIECGVHYPHEGRFYDFLVITHAHEVSEDQETTEEI
jgi:hypothetical protein